MDAEFLKQNSKPLLHSTQQTVSKIRIIIVNTCRNTLTMYVVIIIPQFKLGTTVKQSKNNMLQMNFLLIWSSDAIVWKQNSNLLLDSLALEDSIILIICSACTIHVTVVKYI